MTIRCPESVIGAHQPGRDGRCRWCGQQAENPVPAPPTNTMPTADLAQAYGYYLDPDFGQDHRDAY